MNQNLVIQTQFSPKSTEVPHNLTPKDSTNTFDNLYHNYKSTEKLFKDQNYADIPLFSIINQGFLRKNINRK